MPQHGEIVDWRVSAANLAALQRSFERRQASQSPAATQGFRTVATGLSKALAHGDALWRQIDDDDEVPASSASTGAPPPSLRGPVYLITDAHCASACLDAVDLWRALGAVHVGRTTSADTLYMDVRHVALPSGLSGFSLPMKVYRDRPRGSNVPVVPVHRFSGDIGDTPALERWIATLPERRRASDPALTARSRTP